MFMLINDVHDKSTVVKRNDIRRIYPKNDTESFICFNNPAKNTPITVKGTPEDFFKIYLENKL